MSPGSTLAHPVGPHPTRGPAQRWTSCFWSLPWALPTAGPRLPGPVHTACGTVPKHRNTCIGVPRVGITGS